MGADGFALIIVPSLDLVIYKMGGNNRPYGSDAHGHGSPWKEFAKVAKVRTRFLLQPFAVFAFFASHPLPRSLAR
jgi:hypothetical protein